VFFYRVPFGKKIYKCSLQHDNAGLFGNPFLTTYKIFLKSLSLCLKKNEYFDKPYSSSKLVYVPFNYKKSTNNTIKTFEN